MKEISKVKAFMKKSLSSIILEKHILSNLHHPFLANLNFSFQDKEYLYLVLDFLPGGDLRFYLNKGIVFSEIQIKFFISNLILALDYIHKMNIIHRDIKPENLVFDGRGYLHITDFGIARKMKNGKQQARFHQRITIVKASGVSVRMSGWRNSVGARAPALTRRSSIQPVKPSPMEMAPSSIVAAASQARPAGVARS